MFQTVAEIVHILLCILLLQRVYASKSVKGISVNTLQLYLIAYCLRYVDLLLYVISIYNTLMKIAILSTSVYTYHLVLLKQHQTFRLKEEHRNYIKKILFISAILTIFIHSTFISAMELIWSYSVWIEGLACLPQLIFLKNLGGPDTAFSNYVAALGIYRLIYVLNWYSLNRGSKN